MRYFTNVHDLGDLKSALAEAFEIKKDRYKYETLGKHKTCLLIFFNNSLRTRLSTRRRSRLFGSFSCPCRSFLCFTTITTTL